ncbi:hypothetical protein [Flavobacterium sp.]|uniref:hypothetical protein n=1 Tax=Flavobacterium sp. TaxID=239 RepID=UPI0039E56FEC
MRKLLLLLVFMLFAVNTSAQDSRNSGSGVMEIKAFIASLRANETASRNSNSNAYSPAQSVEDLVYKLQPSQYLKNGMVKTYGEKPRHLFLDKQSLNGLNNPALLKNNIDIVTIRINSANDLIGTIDLSLFSSFKSLKYVHIVSAVPATSSQLSNLVSNAEERLSVFYSIENGERNQ